MDGLTFGWGCKNGVELDSVFSGVIAAFSRLSFKLGIRRTVLGGVPLLRIRGDGGPVPLGDLDNLFNDSALLILDEFPVDVDDSGSEMGPDWYPFSFVRSAMLSDLIVELLEVRLPDFKCPYFGGLP